MSARETERTAPLHAGWWLRWIPLGTVVALVATAWGAPGWAWVPLGVTAAGNLWIFISVWRGPSPSTARRAVVWSAVAGVAAGVGVLVGAAVAGGLAILLALGTGWAAVRHSLREMPPAPPSLVSKRPPRWTLFLGSALDLSLVAIWELGAGLRSGLPLARVKEDIDRACDRYAAAGWNRTPGRAFQAPPPIETVELSSRRVADEQVEDLRFESAFEPFDPEIAPVFASHKRNRQSRALLWRHSEGPTRPALISIHGFGMGNPAIDLRWLRVRGWDMPEVHRSLDIDIAYYILPFHGSRATGRRSGHGFFDQHPLLTNAGIAQAIWDVRRLADWLRAQGAPRVGVHGISLGGYIASLLASLDRDLAVAMPTIPAVDFVPLVWRQLPGFRRREWRRAQIEPDVLERAWALHSPLCHTPQIDTAARMIVGAYGDRITPPTETLRLWEHWDRCKLHWFPGTHLLWRGGDALPMRWAAHLNQFLVNEQADAVLEEDAAHRATTGLEEGSASPAEAAREDETGAPTAAPFADEAATLSRFRAR